MLAEADQAAADGGFRRFASAQNQLNLFQRAALDEVLPACAELGLSFIPYYPLASGMLSRKMVLGWACGSSRRRSRRLSVRYGG